MYKYITLPGFYYWINQIGNDNEERIHYIIYNLFIAERGCKMNSILDSVVGLLGCLVFTVALLTVRTILLDIQKHTHNAKIKADIEKVDAEIDVLLNDVGMKEKALSESLDAGEKTFLSRSISESKNMITKKQELKSTLKSQLLH